MRAIEALYVARTMQVLERLRIRAQGGDPGPDAVRAEMA